MLWVYIKVESYENVMQITVFGFVVLSPSNPETESHDPEMWKKMCHDTKNQLAQKENRPFNRWRVDDPIYAKHGSLNQKSDLA